MAARAGKKQNTLTIIIIVLLFIVFIKKGSFLGAGVPLSSSYLDLTDIDLSQLPSQSYGAANAVWFSVRATGTSVSADRGYKKLDEQIYTDVSNIDPGAGKIWYLQVVVDSAAAVPKYNIDINAGEKITLKYSGHPDLVVHLPSLQGDIRNYQGLISVKLYIGADGSTYWDSAMNNLAQAAPTLPPSCTPDCSLKTCGDDGCGGSCGTCGTGFSCQTDAEGLSQCVANACVPKTSCSAGVSCGQESDGCGGFVNCGTCGTSQVCASGACQSATCTVNDVVYGWEEINIAINKWLTG